MDKEFLKKYKLEESVKRLNQICEYTFITSPTLSEDGDDELQPNDNVQDNGQTDGNQQQQGNQNQQMGNEMNQQPQQGQEQMADTDNSMDNDFDVENDDEMTSDEGNETMNDTEEDDLSFETEEMQEGDEVIDIDDLTQSQEATEYKVDDTNRKLVQILNVVSKFSDALDANNKKIEDLRDEFEKRNPTEEEKLNLRSQASYPYSEQPKEYWDKKMAQNPHYNVMYDNDVSTSDEQKKFEIKQSDIDNFNYNEIGKSYDEPLRLDDFLKF